VTDLAELALPFHDEPHHPMQGRYLHEHTGQWSAIVDAADAFVFVMPEYNYAFSAPLKNAIDYPHREWAYKPVGFVSYGGASGGLRAVQMLKQVVTTLTMFPLTAQVAVPHYRQYLSGDAFVPGPDVAGSAKATLDELARVVPAFQTLRPAR
jgi:NAD(P)H-dependent FMN reductase